ncbi:hypothetical protein [Paenarthrobacter nicotinovorans]|uniref:hypothetical protein n=1 Tax=Paenarthrobacter nicotinovorans TaxID=29320 RepID=UPI00047C1AD4|nr:hypothetical protein [Paenarthrobacter nicotinovorans]
MESEAVHLHNEHSFDQEVHAADAWELNLGVIANPVGFEQVLGVNFHDGFGPQIEFLKDHQSRPRLVCREFLPQQGQGNSVKPNSRNCHCCCGVGLEASERVNHGILHARDGKCWIAVEPHGPVPHET